MIHAIFIAFLILLIIGTLPRWSHSRNWGYYPSGSLLVILTLVLLLLIK
ncbi:DUF3309 family protein [Pelagicoccus sp. SDUM812003]